MNAPFILAQADIGSAPASASRVIKVAKPQGEQAISLRLDNTARLDLSDIVNEKVTFVHVGDRLVILFDNQATVTIAGFFDDNGQPFQNLSIEVADSKVVGGAEFALLFPISDDASILPAAGEAGAARSAASFHDASVDGLGSSNGALSLLNGEGGFGSGLGDGENATNTVPRIGSPEALLTDDEGLSEGNLDGPGDAPGQVVSATRSLEIDFGQDLTGRSIVFDPAQPGLVGLTSSGQAISFVMTTIGGLPTLIGYVGTDPGVAANHVFEVSLDAGPLNGTYTFTLLAPLDHPIADTEDSITLPIRFTAIDGNGDSASGVFVVTVNDDSPIVTGTPIATTVDEDGGLSGGNLFGAGDSFATPTTASGSLKISWGADRADTVDAVGLQDGASHNTVSAPNALTGRAVYFADNVVTLTGTNELTSRGQTVLFRVVDDGTKLEAYVVDGQSSHVVFDVTLSDETAGSYTFTLRDVLDHPGHEDPATGGTQTAFEDNIGLTFNFTARDFDGDTVSNTFTVTVDDDTPVIVLPVNSTVDEDGPYLDPSLGLPNSNPGPLLGGNDALLAGVSSFGTLGISWGADNANPTLGGGLGDRSVVFNGVVDGAAVTYGATALTSNGLAVRFARLDDQTVVGYTGTEAPTATTGATVVFVVTLSDDGILGAGRYDFTLKQTLDHPPGGNENNINLTFGFDATDSDGDKASSSFTVTVNDDSIVQGNADDRSIDEESLAGGNAGDSYSGLTGGNADLNPNPGTTGPSGGQQVGGGLGVSWGADRDLKAEWLDGPNGTIGAVDDAIGRTVSFVNGSGTVLSVGNATASQLGLGSLTSDGVALSYSISYLQPVAGTWNGGYVLTAFKTGNPSDVVFKLTLDPTSTDGSYTFELLGNIDHSGSNAEDNLNIDFRFRAADADGDFGPTETFRVTVDDDAPVIGTIAAETLAETTASGNSNAFQTQTLSNISLHIGWGADNANPNTGTFDCKVAFNAALDNSVPAGLKSNGIGLIYDLSADGTGLTAYRFNGTHYISSTGGDLGDNPSAAQLETARVFSVQLSDSGNGSYTFNLFDNLDHTSGNGTTLDLNFGFNAGDADGDTVAASFTVKVTDNVPVLVGNADTGTMSEASVLNGVGSTSGNLGIDWNADDRGSAHLEFTKDNLGNPNAPAGLTSDGVALRYAIRLASNGVDEELVAYKTGETVDQPVFIVALNSPGNPAFAATLYQNLDHVGTGNDTTLALTFTARAVDGDNDYVDRSFSINITDTTPVAGNPARQGLEEAAATHTLNNVALGISWGADDTNNGPNGIDRSVAFASTTAANNVVVQNSSGTPIGLTSNGATISYTLLGGVLVAYTGAAALTNINDSRVVFTVSLSDDGAAHTGTYSFDLRGPIDHPAPVDGNHFVDLNISYTATDADRDTSQPGAFTVRIDAAGTITGLAHDTIDYSALTGAVVVDLNANMATGAAVGIDQLGTAIVNATGGSGNDTLIGGAEANVLNGGAGNDTIVYRIGDGNDTIDGGEGNETIGDTLVVNGDANAQSLTLQATAGGFNLDTTDDGTAEVVTTNVENLAVNLAGGTDALTVSGLESGETITLAGTLANVTVTGTNLPAISVTGAEDINIRGEGGNDTIDASQLGLAPTAAGTGLAGDNPFGSFGNGRPQFVAQTFIANSDQLSQIAFSLEGLNGIVDFRVLVVGWETATNKPLAGGALYESGTLFHDTAGRQSFTVAPGTTLTPGQMYAFILDLNVEGDTQQGTTNIRTRTGNPEAAEPGGLYYTSGSPGRADAFSHSWNGSVAATMDLAYQLGYAERSLAINLDGGAGNDTITGSSGADNIFGGVGDDTITGGKGNDALDGGEGDDIFHYSMGDGFDTIQGGQGAETAGDTLIVHGDAGAQTLTLAATSATGFMVDTDGVSGAEIKASRVENVTLEMAAGTDAVNIVGLNTGETIALAGTSASFTISGTNLPTTTVTGAESVTIKGEGGNDTIDASQLILTPGSAQVGSVPQTHGTGVNGTALGTGFGDASATTSRYAGQTFVAANSEVLSQLSFSLVYTTGTLDLRVLLVAWDAVNNRPVGGAPLFESETLVSSDPNFNTFIVNPNLALTQGQTYAFILDAQAPGTSQTGSASLAMYGAGSPEAAEPGNFVVVAPDDKTRDVAFAQSWLGGNSANDLAYQLVYGAAQALGVSLDGGEGDDTITGSTGSDVILGGTGDDTVDGGKGNDTITGGAGDDILNGGEGNDTFIYAIGDGADTIEGADGADRLVVTANANAQSARLAATADGFMLDLDGVAGAEITAKNVDIVDLNLGAGIDTLKFVGRDTGERMTVSGVGTSFIIAGSALPTATVTGAESVAIHGEGGNDTIDASGLDLSATPSFGVTLDGGAGNDTITGSSINDTMYGGAGDDILVGGYGNDTIFGGADNDTITGGTGDDTLNGGDGDDTFNYGIGEGIDTIDGGIGADRLVANGNGNVQSLTLTATSATSFTLDTDGVAGAEVSASNVENATIIMAEGADKLTVAGLATSETITLAGNDKNFTVSGTNLPTTTVTDAENATIRGEGGNDTINASGLSMLPGTTVTYDGTSLSGYWTAGPFGDQSFTAKYLAQTFVASSAEKLSEVRFQLQNGRGTLDFFAKIVDWDTATNTPAIVPIYETWFVYSGDQRTTFTMTPDVYLTPGKTYALLFDAWILRGTADTGYASFVSWGHDAETAEPGGIYAPYIYGDGTPYYTMSWNDQISDTDIAYDLRYESPASQTFVLTLDGGDGDDVITGSVGNDLIFGGADNDTINYTAGNGHDVVDGGSGDDKLNFHATNNAETVNINAITLNGEVYLGINVEGAPYYYIPATDSNSEVATKAIEDIFVSTYGGNDTVFVTGGLGGAGVAPSIIHIEMGTGDDVLDLTFRDSAQRVVADGGADTDVVYLDFSKNDAYGATQNIYDQNGSLIGVKLTHQVGGVTITDEFTNFENFSFRGNGGGTLEEIANHAPVVTSGAAAGSVAEDATLVSAVEATSGIITFIDIDSPVHTVTYAPATSDYGAFLGTFSASLTQGSNGGTGQVTWNFSVADSLIQFLHQDQVITQTYTVQIADATGGVTTETVTVKINGTLDAPQTAAISAAGNEDGGAIAVTLSGTAYESAVSFFKISSDTANGVLYGDAALTEVLTAGSSVSASGNAATVYFVPTHNWYGDTSFDYATVDSFGTADTSPATATVTVAPTNDAPDDIAFRDALDALVAPAGGTTTLIVAEMSANGAAVGKAIAHDVDNNDTHTYKFWNGSAASQTTADGRFAINATTGAITVANGSLLDYETSGASHSFGYTVRVTDNSGASYNESVTIALTDVAEFLVTGEQLTVVNVLTPPSGVMAPIEDGKFSVAAASLLANDTGVGLQIVSAQGAQHGAVSLSGTTITFTPAANYAGAASFTYTVQDSHGVTSTATASFNLAPVDDGDAPISITGTPLTGSMLTANLGSDPDGATSNVTYQWLRDGAVISGATGSTYKVLVSDFAHQIAVQVGYVDGQNFAESVTAAVTIANQAPVVTGETIKMSGYGPVPPGSAASTPIFNEVDGTPGNNSAATANDIARSAFLVAPNTDLTNAAFPSLTVKGELRLHSDNDFYRIYLNAGERLILDIDNVIGTNGTNGALDTTLRLWNPSGTSVAYNDDSSANLGGTGSAGHIRESYIDYTVPAGASGYYIIDLESFRSAGTTGDTGYYDLNVSIGNFVADIGGVARISVADLLANDIDPDGHALTMVSVSGSGVTLVDNNSFVEVQYGVTSFTYTVSDGFGGTTTATANVQQFANGYTIAGTSADEVLIGSSGVDTISGGDGNDTLIGGDDIDFLKGEGGNDIIRGGAYNDIIDGGTGTDLLDFSDGTAGITLTLTHSTSAYNDADVSAAGLGFDAYRNMAGIVGTRFNDTLTGSVFADVLKGGAGNDTLAGGQGNDTLTGGAGADTFKFSHTGSANADIITDYNGAEGDKLDLSSLLDAAFGTGSDIGDFVKLVNDGANVKLQVDTDGAGTGAGWSDVATLSNYHTAGNQVLVEFEQQAHQLTVAA